MGTLISPNVDKDLVSVEELENLHDLGIGWRGDKLYSALPIFELKNRVIFPLSPTGAVLTVQSVLQNISDKLQVNFELQDEPLLEFVPQTAVVKHR